MDSPYVGIRCHLSLLNTAPTGSLQDEGRGEKGFPFSEAREACLSLASRTEARLAPQSQQK